MTSDTRVSAKEQILDRQLSELKATDYDQISENKVAGRKGAVRPE